MAKPMATTHNCWTHPPISPSNRPRGRPHRTPKSFFAPSSGLLSILATIVSSSGVDGSPAPPTFLCPSIDVDDQDLSKSKPSRRQVAPQHPTPVPSASTSRPSTRIPDKFVRGADSKWRRAAYTLYGSTVCPDCPEPTAPIINDQIQVPAQNASATSTSSYDIRDSLPPGWKPVAKPYQSRTTLILALSLVLAFFICFFIIGCLFWRKHVRRKHKEDSDLEMKLKTRRQASGQLNASRESMIEKENEMKSKQKIWARATARWKANARYSARLRKGKRTTRLSHNQTFNNSRNGLTSAHSSPPQSRTSSRRSSTTSRSLPSVFMASTTPLTDPPNITVNSTTSPPAYHQRISVPSNVAFTEGLSPTDLLTVDRLLANGARRPSHPNIYDASPADEYEHDPPPIHDAHVATDDKALLARLAGLASEPAVVESSGVEVSAPIWYDEHIETDLITSIDQAPEASTCAAALSFPPPPSKGKMALPDFHNYPLTFEEMVELEQDPGPSAPPFEEGSSIDLQDDPSLMPTAPPLLDEENFHPSAPGHELASSCEANEDVCAESGDGENSLQAEVSTSSLPFHEGLVSCEGILPHYRP